MDDRSRVLVHLGTEPGSKAYRLLDPKSKQIVVSRDVISDKETEWNWNKTEQIKDGDHEEFEMSLRPSSDEDTEDKVPAIDG